jgi:hypothetical protein
MTFELKNNDRVSEGGGSAWDDDSYPFLMAGLHHDRTLTKRLRPDTVEPGPKPVMTPCSIVSAKLESGINRY